MSGAERAPTAGASLSEGTEQAIVDAFEYLIEDNPYYGFLDIDVTGVERGQLRATLPFNERTAAPDVTPGAIHGGAITTLVDGVGMGAVLAQKGELRTLVTEDLSVTFHDGATETVLAEGTVISDGETLVTSRVDVYPAAEYGTADPTLVASGTTTARLFD